MNDNLKLWADALRSDSYAPNNTSDLISFDANGHPTFSSLGVGCDTYRHMTQWGKWLRGGMFLMQGYRPCPTMPPPMLEWYGLTETPSLLNKTFAEAADVLDPPTA